MADGFVQATLRLPFPEQIAAFRLRLGALVPTARWDDIAGQAQDRAFMVAGATKADLLADLAAAVDRGIAEGRTLDDFRRDFRAIVERHGWHGWTGEGSRAGEAWRTRVIWRTNMATTYAAGRRAQLEAGNFAFWVYRHGGSREPRPQHLAWDGLALPPDHPFWATHAPPNGWGCSCRIFGARTAKGVRRLGGDPDKTLPPGWDARDPRTGAPPGIDRGWAHAPGAGVTQDIVAQIRAKAARLPEPLAQALTSAIEGRAVPPAAPAAPGPTLDEAMDLLADLDPALTGDLRRAAAIDAPALSAGERVAVHAYTHPVLYARLNDHLRAVDGGAAADDRLVQWGRMLSGALGRLPARPGTSYRGVDVTPALLARFEALAPGDVVRFAGFTSTSSVETSALAGEVMLVIRGRTGRDISALSLTPQEREVLFGPGTRFRVIDRRVTRGPGYDILRIEVEEVLPGDYVATTVRMTEESEHAGG
jgi:hypothetical protein